MGNTLRSKRAAKVMKINGETMKFKTPIHAGNVVENYPGHVLLESEAVKHFGIRAKPLDPSQELKPKVLYFLVQLPKFPEEKTPRRVRSSGIHMTAKDRLESLMLSRRTVSDLSNMKPASIVFEDAKEIRSNDKGKGSSASASASTRLKMRIPKSEVEKLMMQCKDEDDVAAKIVDFCMENHTNGRRFHGPAGSPNFQQHVTLKQEQEENGILLVKKSLVKSHEKRVGFRPVTEAEIHAS